MKLGALDADEDLGVPPEIASPPAARATESSGGELDADAQRARLAEWSTGAPMQAEELLLGTILAFGRGAALEASLEVSEEHFCASAHQAIYRAVMQLMRDETEISVPLVHECLVGMGITSIQHNYLLGLASQAVTASHARFYARRVADYAGARAFTMVAATVGDLARRATRSVEQLEENLAQATMAMLEIKVSRAEAPLPLGETALHMASEFQIGAAFSERRISGLTTGFQRLDDALGGLSEGDLIVLGGRPGSGKTSFAMAVAHHISGAEQAFQERKDDSLLRAVVYSMEMTRPQLTERSIAALGMVNLMDVRARAFRDVGAGRRAMRAAEALARVHDRLTIDDRPRLRLGQLLSSMAREVALRPVSLFIIDHKDLIRRDSDKDPLVRDDVAWLAHVTGSLKEAAKRLKTRVLLLSQMNRSIETRTLKMPVMSDLRGSGAVEQDADAVLFVHRPALYDAAEPKDKAVLVVAKARSGETGEIPMRWVGPSTAYLPDFDAVLDPVLARPNPGAGFHDLEQWGA